MKSKNINSIAIEDAVRLAIANGNQVGEVSEGWSNVKQVVYMVMPLAEALRSVLIKNLRLRHWSSEPTPHNRAEEGFTDDMEKISIAFPIH